MSRLALIGSLALISVLFTPRPVSSDEPVVDRSRFLDEAVEAFNARAKGAEGIGRDQESLTVDEVIAAIRFTERPRVADVSDAVFRAFTQIAETRKLPDDARFEVLTSIDPGEDYIFEGWWVRIELRKENGGTYSFPIRSRVVRSFTLEEKLTQAEQHLKVTAPPLPGFFMLEKRAQELRDRIARRDARKRSKS
jgi:hypothetical protein